MGRYQMHGYVHGYMDNAEQLMVGINTCLIDNRLWLDRWIGEWMAGERMGS